MTSKYISADRSIQYMLEARTYLKTNILFMYEDLNIYLKDIGKNRNRCLSILINYSFKLFSENEFSGIVNTSIDLKKYHTYDELLDMLNLCHNYRNKATQLVDIWKFNLGT